jgi:RecA/RadA recombinase
MALISYDGLHDGMDDDPTAGMTEKQKEAYYKKKEKEAEERLKEFNKTGIRKASEFKRIQASLDAIETGVYPLDMAIGYLGPSGHMGVRQRDIVELIGPNMNGKTAVADQMILTTQKRFGPDSVFGLFSEPPEVDRLERKGIDLDGLMMRCCFDPDIDYKKNLAEQHLEAALEMAENPKTKVVIIDSVAALCSASQLFETGKSKNPDFRDLDVTPVAALAKVFNNFLVQWNGRNKSNSVLLLLNHYKPSIDTQGKMRSDEVWTPGGRAKEFLAWVRIMVRGSIRVDDFESTDRHSVEGNKLADVLQGTYEIFKNKYAHTNNNRVVKWALDLETGLYNNEERLIKYASLFGDRVDDPNMKGKKITRSILEPKLASAGAWTYIGDEGFNGGDKAAEYLRANPDVYESLKMQMYKLSPQFFKDQKPDFESLMES